jgi:hypothetical protein
MYVWEMIVCRLQGEGWSVWHTTDPRDDDGSYTVHLHRPGMCEQATGPTLTEAYAEAARRAHRHRAPSLHGQIPTPHFALQASLL